MIIEKVTVKRLRAIKEKTIDFSPGLNIIKGDNEAGKSSLRIAITKALFQDPTSTQKNVETLTRWGTDEHWEVVLEFSAGADRCRITKSIKEKTGELVCIGAHEFTARNKNAIAEKIAGLTGCPSEIFFESTACIGQDELIRIIPKGATNLERQEAVGTITKRLQAKLSGTEEINIPALLTRLYNKTHHKDAKGPHFHLATVTERIANLRNQRHDQELKVNDILEKRTKLAQAKEQLKNIDQNLPDKQQLLNKNKEMLEIQKEITRDRAQYDTYQTAKGIKLKVENLENELSQFSRFINAEEKMKQVEATKNKLNELSRQRDVFLDDLKAIRRQKPVPWTLVSGLVLIAGGLIGLIANPYLGLAAIAGFVLSAYWAIALSTWQKQIKFSARKTDELESKIRDTDEKTRSLLNEFGCKNYDEYQERVTEYRAKTEVKRDALNQLEVLLAGKNWQSFVEGNADLDIEISAMLKKSQQLESYRLEPLALQNLEKDVTNALKQKADLELEKGALEKYLQYTDADQDQLVNVEEELKQVEQERVFWERKMTVFETTREIIEQAHKQTLAKAADLLEDDISRYIASITDHRYSLVKVDESDLTIRTYSSEKNDWVDVADLSRATQDQFYICARLALVRLITEDKKPPILLDDPFVNFHTKRLRKTMTVLQEIAKKNQIILFTCSDSYDYLGAVVSID